MATQVTHQAMRRGGTSDLLHTGRLRSIFMLKATGVAYARSHVRTLAISLPSNMSGVRAHLLSSCAAAACSLNSQSWSYIVHEALDPERVL